MKIYLAGPVVTNDEKVKMQMGQLQVAVQELRGNEPIEIYRPGAHKVPNEWGIDMRTWGQCVFTMDVVAIDQCDWMVVADYGRVATAGTSWECGYAFAKGVKILVVQMPGVEESSLMTQGCAANICTYDEIVHHECKMEDFLIERGRRKTDGVVLN